MSMAGIDIVFMVIVAILALRCAARGFISELMSMAALIFGILAAIFFFRKGAVLVRDLFMPGVKSLLPEVIAFAVLFLLVYIVIKIVEATLKSIIEGVKLGDLDHLFGFLFGCVEGIVIVCLIIFLISIQPFFDIDTVLGKSFFAKILLPFITGDRKDITESIARLAISGGGGV